MDKELFINSIRQIRIDGHTIVPTIVCYKDKHCFAGYEALDAAENQADLREDFKIEIGNSDPLKLAQRGSSTAPNRRSTLGIAKDFIDNVVDNALEIVERQGFEKPSRILVAEPLALSQASETITHDDWLRNYRASVKRILTGKFAEIDFMPEPFAVFQYYRYGVKHPLVAQRTKHIALVFDFGGGTFDASVIETTAAGDISQGGRNSKPLAARSLPVGGFVVNQFIARELLFRGLEKGVDKATVTRAIEAYDRYKNADDEELSLVRQDQAAFVRNFRRLLRSVEQAKLAVSSGITSWRLDANLSSSPACPVDVPQRPMQADTAWVPIRLEPHDLRHVFCDRVWKQKLLPEIVQTLKRAEHELSGRSISIVLLSGGSSNLGWLKQLIERDLSAHLQGAEVLELSENFQEIVAKGLAVECARRFYTEGQGDFRAVTYNRLCLGLNPNGNGLEFKKYIPESAELAGTDSEFGVLIPSSTSLRGLVDRALKWKVRLSKAPTQSLDYFFMRSSFDPEDAGARHNIDSRAPTPRGTSFSSGIEVELKVREDGTALPSFIYGRGAQGQQVVVSGRPFYLDMTFAPNEAGVTTYLGFDFGTSTSSLCYVNAGDIKVYADRASDKTWLSLSNLLEVLPYPTAYPLARFLSETTAELVRHRGREAIEAMLAFITYVAFQEHCCLASQRGVLLKSFRKRSAGPLWDLFKRCASSTGAKWVFAKDLLPLVSEAQKLELDQTISAIAQIKHDKAVEIDYARSLERLGNAVARMMKGRVFGFFEDARRKPFSMNAFHGVFRNARGSSSPFVDVYEYEGSDDFPQEFAFLVDIKAENALPLSPLLVRGIDRLSSNQRSDPDFFFYDIARDQEVGFKAVQDRPEAICSNEQLNALYDMTRPLLEADPIVHLLSGVKLTSRLVRS